MIDRNERKVRVIRISLKPRLVLLDDMVVNSHVVSKSGPSLSLRRLKSPCSLAALGFAMRFKPAVLVSSNKDAVLASLRVNGDK